MKEQQLTLNDHDVIFFSLLINFTSCTERHSLDMIFVITCMRPREFIIYLVIACLTAGTQKQPRRM